MFAVGWRLVLSVFLGGMATAVSAATAVDEPPREIPVAYRVDVVVVGGSTGAVSAAASAARAGAKVFLAAPHPYLGDDMTATLRLWPEPGATPREPAGPADSLPTRLAGMFCPDPNRLRARLRKPACPARRPHTDTQPPSLSDRRLVGQCGRGERAVQQRRADHGRPALRASGRQSPRDLLRAIVARSAPCRGIQGRSHRGIRQRRQASLAAACVLRNCRRPAKARDDQGECFALEAAVAAEVPLREFFGPQVARRRPHSLGSDRNRRARPPHAPAIVRASARPPAARQANARRSVDRARAWNFLYGCYATDVLRDADGNPCGIVMANRAGRQAVVAKTIIDATERALVARLAGVEFRPYPAGPHTFHRVVIGGEPRGGPGIDVRKVEPSFRGAPRVQPGEKRRKRPSAAGVYPIYDYTLTLPMKDGSFASWADAEQRARQMTYHARATVHVRRVVRGPTRPHVRPGPPLRGLGRGPTSCRWTHSVRRASARLYVLGGCADVSREQAERLLRPTALIDLGSRIGRAAAAEAKTLPLPADPRLARDGRGRPIARRKFANRSPGVRAVQDWAKIPPGSAGFARAGKLRRGGRRRRHGRRAGRHRRRTPGSQNAGGGILAQPGRRGHRGGHQQLLRRQSRRLHGHGAGRPEVPSLVHRAEDRVVAQQAPRGRGRNLVSARSAAARWSRTAACCGAVVATPQGRGVVLGKVVVDATGNADIASAAGAECIYTGAGEFAMQGTGLPPRQLGGSYANTDFTFTDETDLIDVWHLLVFAKHKYPRAFDQGQLVDTRERRSHRRRVYPQHPRRDHAADLSGYGGPGLWRGLRHPRLHGRSVPAGDAPRHAEADRQHSLPLHGAQGARRHPGHGPGNQRPPRRHPADSHAGRHPERRLCRGRGRGHDRQEPARWSGTSTSMPCKSTWSKWAT